MSDLGGFPPVLTGTAQISPQTWQLVWIQAGAGTHSTGTLEPLYATTLVLWYTGIQVYSSALVQILLLQRFGTHIISSSGPKGA